MSRSKWKGSYMHKSLFRLENKLLNMTDKQRKRFQIIIKSRSSVIPEFLVGFRVQIHNGYVKVNTDENSGRKSYKYNNKPILITEKHVGFKFGEFSLTRKPHSVRTLEELKKLNKKIKKSGGTTTK